MLESGIAGGIEGYPEDRGTNSSVRIGRESAALIAERRRR
jgi:hypothetical protein